MEGKKVELKQHSIAVFDVVVNDRKTYDGMIEAIRKYREGGSWLNLKHSMKGRMNRYLDKQCSSLSLKYAGGYSWMQYSQLDHLVNALLHRYSEEVFGFEFDKWCGTNGRPPTSVVDALDYDAPVDYSKVSSKIKLNPKKMEKKPMESIIKIENKVLVNGVDVNDMTDDTIFNQIAASEAEITRLEAIKTKPKKLTARIKEIQDGIEGLVKIVDGRK